MPDNDTSPFPEKKPAPHKKPGEAHQSEKKEEIVPFPPVITHKDIAHLWDVVIRAHYLAHELGNPCASSGLAAARMALSLSEVLSSWATIFGEELEKLEKRSENEGGA